MRGANDVIREQRPPPGGLCRFYRSVRWSEICKGLLRWETWWAVG